MTKNSEPQLIPPAKPDPKAIEAAERIKEIRAARLRPPKFKENADRKGEVGIHYGDDDSSLKALDLFRVSDADAASLLLRQLAQLFDREASTGNLTEVNGGLALLHELKPQDPAETMLCSQMVGTHMLAMECLKRANLAKQSFEGRELNMRHGERFLRIYAQQLDALNKHRGKGQQKVTVEHVTVNEGGQAVVGSVGR